MTARRVPGNRAVPAGGGGLCPQRPGRPGGRRLLRPRQRHLAAQRGPVRARLRAAGAAAAGAAPAGHGRRRPAQPVARRPRRPVRLHLGLRADHDLRRPGGGPGGQRAGAADPHLGPRHRPGHRQAVRGGRPRPARSGCTPPWWTPAWPRRPATAWPSPRPSRTSTWPSRPRRPSSSGCRRGWPRRRWPSSQAYFAGVRPSLATSQSTEDTASYLLGMPDVEPELAEVWQVLSAAAVATLPDWARAMYGFGDGGPAPGLGAPRAGRGPPGAGRAGRGLPRGARGARSTPADHPADAGGPGQLAQDQ